MTVKLPASFVHDRIFLHPVTVDGSELTLYADTGGGSMFISADTVAHLRLTPQRRVFDGQECDFVHPPAFRKDTPLPMGVHLDGFIVRDDIPPDYRDGFLGQSWFADRVWHFDYLRRELTLLNSWQPPPDLIDHACELGFQRAEDGRRTNAFPRIRAEIDGEILDFLFDTGATVSLTPHALNALNDAGGGALRGTSFITNTLFERWHARHPDWQVIDHADATADEAMIQVPQVRVAGYAVGPVWFVRRRDWNFHEYMSQWMDKRVDGALGGSLLRYFSVTVEYARAVTYFRMDEQRP